MAASRSFVGGTWLAMMSASWLLRQLSFVAMEPPGPTNSRFGSASLPATGREGPMARTMTRFGWVPVTMKPPIKTLSPVSTRRRVEMLPRVAGVGVGAPPVMVKLASEISKKMLPTASTLMRPMVVLICGTVTDSVPSFGVLSARTVGKVSAAIGGE